MLAGLKARGLTKAHINKFYIYLLKNRNSFQDLTKIEAFQAFDSFFK